MAPNKAMQRYLHSACDLLAVPLFLVAVLPMSIELKKGRVGEAILNTYVSASSPCSTICLISIVVVWQGNISEVIDLISMEMI